MPSFGLALRRAREQQGFSFDDVARDTHLSKRYLLALEDEAIHELPGGPYNRAYVRAYAGYLGLDSDSLVRDYALDEEAQTKAGLARRPDVLATMRQAAERLRSRPAPGRSGLATAARVGGLAGVAGNVPPYQIHPCRCHSSCTFCRMYASSDSRSACAHSHAPEPVPEIVSRSSSTPFSVITMVKVPCG